MNCICCSIVTSAPDENGVALELPKATASQFGLYFGVLLVYWLHGAPRGDTPCREQTKTHTRETYSNMSLRFARGVHLSNCKRVTQIGNRVDMLQ